jgi:hypothetical protein
VRLRFDFDEERLRLEARRGAVRVLARLVDGASDEQLERRFSASLAQRALFTAMARSYSADVEPGFEGRLVYVLERPATGRPPARWTIHVHDGRATAYEGGDSRPRLTVRFRLSDFVRIAAGELDAVQPLLANRASFDGDFGLAAKLPEMFGAPRP